MTLKKPVGRVSPTVSFPVVLRVRGVMRKAYERRSQDDQSIKTDPAKKYVKDRLDDPAMARLARWTACSIYWRLVFSFLALFVVLALPIVLVGLTQSYRWLVLWPVLFIAWWSCGGSSITFDPKKACPTCQKPLQIVTREEGSDYNYYLVCSHCGREKQSATASWNS